MQTVISNETKSSGNLVRKQFLVSENNVKKLDSLAKSRGASAAEIVRLAIDAYDPHGAGKMDSDELMELVSSRLKEAIESTHNANELVCSTLEELEKMKG